jgi:hypothetical protein
MKRPKKKRYDYFVESIAEDVSLVIVTIFLTLVVVGVILNLIMRFV